MFEVAVIALEQNQTPIELYDEQQGYGEQFFQLASILDQLIPASTFGSLLARSSAETVARDIRNDCDERVEALQRWLAEDPEGVANFVADQLADQAEHDSDWLEMIVRAADSVVFSSDRFAFVAASLLDAADFFRHLDEYGASEICWIAIHRAGSLIPTNQIGSFQRFLENEGFVDTKLAALQAIFSVIEAAPLSDSAELAALRSRIETIGQKVLDSDVFSAGELSAIGIECTMTLAGLSSDQPNPLVGAILAQDRAWLTSTVVRRYEDLISSWRCEGSAELTAALESDLSRLRNVGVPGE